MKRWLSGVIRENVRLSGYCLVVDAVLEREGSDGRRKGSACELRIPIWQLRFLIRGARHAYLREAAAMQANADSLIRAASAEMP